MDDVISGAILYAIENYQFEDAVFLAEIYHAEVGTYQSLWLLGTSYFRRGDPRHAAHVLKKKGGLQNPKCTLLYARCCLQFKDQAGFNALSLFKGKEAVLEEIVEFFKEDAGIALFLRGEFLRIAGAMQEAKMWFKESLKCNPFLWSAYKVLCDLGEAVSPEDYFVRSSCPVFSQHINLAPFASKIEQKVQQSQMKKELRVGRDLLHRQRDLPNTPDIFYNAALGSAKGSSTPRQNTSADQLDFRLKRPSVAMQLAYTGGSTFCEEDVSKPSELEPVSPSLTPFAWSLPAVTPDSAALLTARCKESHVRTRCPLESPAVTSTPFSAQHVPSSSLHHQPTTTPLQHPQMQTKPVPSIARVAWSQPQSKGYVGEPAASTLLGTPLDTTSPVHFGDHPDLGDDSGFLMPPPKAPVKSISLALRRSSRISSKIPTQSNVHSPPPNRRRTTASSSRPTHISPHRARQSRMSPRKSTSAESVNTRRSLSFGVSKSSHGMLQDTTNSQDNPVSMEEEGTSGDDITKDKSALRENIELLDTDKDAGVPHPSQQSSQQDMLDGLMSVVRHHASAYKALSSFHLVDTIKLLQCLPKNHLSTSWVQTCLAKSYFYAGKYKKSSEIFARIHHSEPYMIEAMDYYSSLLWHLNKTVELQVLVDDFKGFDHHPVMWVIRGNMQSRLKEQEAAIESYKKAVEKCPSYSYGYTLLGVEYCATEQLNEAMDAFKSATSQNPRQYLAWSGMGMVYEQQEKFDLACTHYKRALMINKRNPLVCSQLGLGLVRLNRGEFGLQLINQAIQMDAQMPVARFNKSLALQALGRSEEALLELQHLSKLVPKEAKVYIQMGQIFTECEKPLDAIQQFSWALKCDPENVSVRQEIDTILQQQGSTAKVGPDLSVSGHALSFDGLEEDGNDDDDDEEDEGEDIFGLEPLNVDDFSDEEEDEHQMEE